MATREIDRYQLFNETLILWGLTREIGINRLVPFNNAMPIRDGVSRKKLSLPSNRISHEFRQHFQPRGEGGKRGEARLCYPVGLSKLGEAPGDGDADIRLRERRADAVRVACFCRACLKQIVRGEQLLGDEANHG